MTYWTGPLLAARRIQLQTQAEIGRARLAGCWHGVGDAVARREAQAMAAAAVAREAAGLAATVVAWRSLKRYPRTSLMRRGLGVYAVVRALARAAGRYLRRVQWEEGSHGQA